MAAPSSSLVPSTRRPIPLQIRPDLAAERIRYQQVNDWIVKDPVSLEYYRLRAEQYCVLRLLDGVRSLEQVRDEFQREFPAVRLTLAQIRQLIADLHAKGLVYGNRLGQGAVLLEQHRKRRRQVVLKSLRSILYIKLPGWDPERCLRALYPAVRWMFSPVALLALLAVIVASWVLLAVQFGEFQRRVPEFQQFFSWPNIAFLWLTMGAAKVVHEFGHGLACRHYGGECHEIGMAFLVFSPCLYCDVSDSWILPSKWQRIAIAAAGMVVEVAISALALLAWWYTRPGLLNHLCLNVFFVTTLTTILFNLNPLLRYDGYYILSDWLEIPNLRVKAEQLLRRTLARWCLGIDLEPDAFLPERGRLWFALYAAASAVYRWMLVFTLTFALYSMLKPYGLQTLGVAAGVLSAVSIVTSLIWSLYSLIAAPRNRPMSSFRVAGTLVLLTGIVAAGLLVPLPLHVEAPFVIEPHEVRHVYTSTPGRLTEVRVRPGQAVKKGDVLIRLDNFHKQDQVEQLRTTREVQAIEAALARKVDDPSCEKLALGALDSTDQQIRDYEIQLQQLTVVAPCDGVVVAPPMVAAAGESRFDSSLPRWSGTPLDVANHGCWLTPRTHVVSIAPDATFQAMLVIDQHDREDFHTGRPVTLKFDHRPGTTRDARIATVADRHLEVAPQQLSNKFGGDLPTVTDRTGEERLANAAYQAIVPLGASDELLKTGLRGRARLTIATRTAGDWLWRSLTRTLHFRL